MSIHNLQQRFHTKIQKILLDKNESGESSLNYQQVLKALKSQLDHKLIARKRKDPHEWKRFVAKGQALNDLVEILQR